jgi:hypothetical protein
MKLSRFVNVHRLQRRDFDRKLAKLEEHPGHRAHKAFFNAYGKHDDRVQEELNERAKRQPNADFNDEKWNSRFVDTWPKEEIAAALKAMDEGAELDQEEHDEEMKQLEALREELRTYRHSKTDIGRLSAILEEHGYNLDDFLGGRRR